MPAEKTPPPPAVPPEEETPVAASEAVELSPTEQKLESVRGKLEQRHEELVHKSREAGEKMQALDIEIVALDAQLPSLRSAVMAAHADLHQAQGAHAAMNGLITRLRKPGESNPVQGLEQLIEENRALARQLAVTLVGEDDADAFLKNPTINEGTARGLVFEIKNTFRITVSDRERILQGLIGKVRTSDPKYTEAQIHLRNAELDLAAAETRRDDLVTQIQRALETIRALQKNIEATDTVARTLEQEQTALRTGNIQTDDKTVQNAMGKERLTHELLGKKRSERDATGILLREFMASEERVTHLLAALDGMLTIYTTATERLAQVPTLVDQMGGLEVEFSQRWTEASHGIQPALVGVGSGVNDAIAGTMGYGIATRDKVIEELRSHEALLGALIGRFNDASVAADASAADPKDLLPWQAYEELVAASENLRRFLEHDLERLQGGSVDKIDALIDRLRQRLYRALRPLAIVRKASDEIAALHAEPPAPAQASAPAATPVPTAPAAAESAAPPAPSRPAAETATPPDAPPPDDDRPDEPEGPPE